jgi:outer membrane protein assembly factor BamB
MIYGLGYTGVYAFNASNGKIVWHYIDHDIYDEIPYSSSVDKETGEDYSSYAFGSTGPVIGGGIVFAPNTEHSPTFVYRGQQLHAIDAFTGEKVWSIKGAYTPSAIAYGILLASDSYNGYSYAFGKGNTETAVSISSKVMAPGSTVLLEGTVLDMSPAQKGSAAIADEYITPWMEYLHMQQPKPTDAKGVEVVFSVVDANNNWYEIGRTNCDPSTGEFSFGWAPEITGKYEIRATFAGSEAYYSSSALTALLVTEDPDATPGPTPQTASMTETYFLPAIIGMTIVIAIFGALILLALTKRKIA